MGSAQQFFDSFRRSRFNFLLLLVLFFPMFFQLANGVYRGEGYFGSGGNLKLLPIPLSVLACYLGVILLGGYACARIALKVVFLTVLAMLLCSLFVLVGESRNVVLAKFVLLAQYFLPMVALIFGMQFGSVECAVEKVGKAAFYIVIFLVPLQLLSTISAGKGYLLSSVYFFSIYQHLQYMPVVFTCFFLIALYSHWESKTFHVFLFPLAGLMGVYAALSVSMLSLFLLSVGVIFFAARSAVVRVRALRSLVVVVVVGIGVGVAFFYLANRGLVAQKFGFLSPLQGGQDGADSLDQGAPKNLEQRLVYWGYYFDGIRESFRVFLFGHEQAPDRNAYPSAHNYYLDFAYNFGVLSVFPMCALVFYTCYQVLRNFYQILKDPKVLSLAGVVVFILLVDNMFKVGLRQPYPGIVSFFLWGVLLSYFVKGETSYSKSKSSSPVS